MSIEQLPDDKLFFNVNPQSTNSAAAPKHSIRKLSPAVARMQAKQQQQQLQQNQHTQQQQHLHSHILPSLTTTEALHAPQSHQSQKQQPQQQQQPNQLISSSQLHQPPQLTQRTRYLQSNLISPTALKLKQSQTQTSTINNNSHLNHSSYKQKIEQHQQHNASSNPNQPRKIIPPLILGRSMHMHTDQKQKYPLNSPQNPPFFPSTATNPTSQVQQLVTAAAGTVTSTTDNQTIPTTTIAGTAAIPTTDDLDNSLLFMPRSLAPKTRLVSKSKHPNGLAELKSQRLALISESTNTSPKPQIFFNPFSTPSTTTAAAASNCIPLKPISLDLPAHPTRIITPHLSIDTNNVQAKDIQPAIQQQPTSRTIPRRITHLLEKSLERSIQLQEKANKQKQLSIAIDDVSIDGNGGEHDSELNTASSINRKKNLQQRMHNQRIASMNSNDAVILRMSSPNGQQPSIDIRQSTSFSNPPKEQFISHPPLRLSQNHPLSSRRHISTNKSGNTIDYNSTIINKSQQQNAQKKLNQSNHVHAAEAAYGFQATQELIKYNVAAGIPQDDPDEEGVFIRYKDKEIQYNKKWQQAKYRNQLIQQQHSFFLNDTDTLSEFNSYNNNNNNNKQIQQNIFEQLTFAKKENIIATNTENEKTRGEIDNFEVVLNDCLAKGQTYISPTTLVITPNVFESREGLTQSSAANNRFLIEFLRFFKIPNLNVLLDYVRPSVTDEGVLLEFIQLCSAVSFSTSSGVSRQIPFFTTSAQGSATPTGNTLTRKEDELEQTQQSIVHMTNIRKRIGAIFSSDNLCVTFTALQKQYNVIRNVRNAHVIESILKVINAKSENSIGWKEFLRFHQMFIQNEQKNSAEGIVTPFEVTNSNNQFTQQPNEQLEFLATVLYPLIEHPTQTTSTNQHNNHNNSCSASRLRNHLDSLFPSDVVHYLLLGAQMNQSELSHQQNTYSKDHIRHALSTFTQDVNCNLLNFILNSNTTSWITHTVPISIPPL